MDLSFIDAAKSDIVNAAEKAHADFESTIKDYQHAAFMYSLIPVVLGVALAIDWSKEGKKKKK